MSKHIVATRPQSGHTRMTRISLDIPAAIPILALHRLAEQHGCKVYRRPDGSFVLRPVANGRAAR